MAEKNFPNVIKKNGVEDGEILFLLEKRDKNKTFRELMKATKESITKVAETETVEKGEEYPIYVQLLDTCYHTGSVGII